MNVLVLGQGVVGSEVGALLARETAVDRSVVVPGRSDMRASLGDLGRAIVVLATPAGHHVDRASAALRLGADVVSVSDNVDDVTGLLALDAEARERGRRVVVGAGFAPGVSCLLARHGRSWFDTVDEIHVAKFGTGGPACARQHHRSLGEVAVDYREGALVRRPGGSGRELVWFPEPVGPADCYRANLADPILLSRAMPGVARVQARMAATRRDRITARLPMLRPPHPEGLLGGVRVELRGWLGGRHQTIVLGVSERPAFAAAAMAAAVVAVLANGDARSPGAAGVAGWGDPTMLLDALSGHTLQVNLFEGTG